MSRALKSRARTGTPLALTESKKGGAWPPRERSRSMRAPEKVMVLNTETAATSTMRLSPVAAAVIPRVLSARTKGEVEVSSSFHGASSTMMPMPPT